MKNSALLKKIYENSLAPLNSSLDLFERCPKSCHYLDCFQQMWVLRYSFIFTIVLRLLGSEDEGKKLDLQEFLEADS